MDTGMSALYALNIRSIVRYVKSESAPFLWLNVYLFLEYVRPQSIYPNIDILPFAQTALLITLALMFREGIQHRARNVETIWISLFSITIILSSAFAYSPTTSFSKLDDFFVWLLVYYLIISIINTEKRFFVFLLGFILYSFKMSQHGFRSFVGRGFGFEGWGVVGAPGWFHNSGEFGIQLSIFLPIVICFMIALWAHWDRWRKSIFILMPLTGIVSVVATSSRGAMLGASAALLWLVGASRIQLKVVIAFLIIATLTYNITPEQSLQRFDTAGVDETSVNRIERWKDGVEIINDNPVLGIGYGNWVIYRAREQGLGGGLPHNIFIQAGSELGYIGLIIFVLMIFNIFRNNLRTRRLARASNNKFLMMTAYGFDGALVGLLVSGSFVTVLYYPYFWIHLAMTVALNNVAKRECGSAQTLISDRPVRRPSRQNPASSRNY